MGRFTELVSGTPKIVPAPAPAPAPAVAPVESKKDKKQIVSDKPKQKDIEKTLNIEL